MKNALTIKQQNVSSRRLSYRKTIGRIADHPLDSPRASVAEAVHRLVEFSKRSNEFVLISILTACIITPPCPRNISPDNTLQTTKLFTTRYRGLQRRDSIPNHMDMVV